MGPVFTSLHSGQSKVHVGAKIMTKLYSQEIPEASKESEKSAKTSYFYYYSVHFLKNNKAPLRYLDLGGLGTRLQVESDKDL